MSPVVPGSKFAERLRQRRQESRRADPHVLLTARCVIEKVFDPPTLRKGNLPDQLVPLILRTPGVLFAQVRLRKTGQRFILPMKDSPDQILSTYGNSVQIQGSPAKVEYRSTGIHRGVVSITNNPFQKLLDLDAATEVYSIGQIFG